MSSNQWDDYLNQQVENQYADKENECSGCEYNSENECLLEGPCAYEEQLKKER